MFTFFKLKKAPARLQVLLMSGALTGCGLTHNLDEMHDSTAHMSNTTDKMNDNTAHLLEKTNDLASDIKVMLGGIKNVSDKMDETNSQVKTIGSQMKEMNTSVKDMGTKVIEVNGTVKAVGSQMMDVLTTVQDVGKKMTFMNTTLSEVGKKIDQVTDEVHGVTIQVDDFHKTVNKVGNQIDHVNDTIVGVGKQMDKIYNQVDQTVVPKMVEINNVVKQMPPQVNTMIGLMRELKKVSAATASDVRHSFVDGRMDAAYKARIVNRDHLKSPLTTTFEAKSCYAGAYFYSSEFQFWLPEEKLEKRYVLFNNAILEFLLTLNDEAPNYTDFDISSKANWNIAAYAVTAERINETQAFDLQEAKSKAPLVSMLDLLESGLKSEKSTKEKHPFQESVLSAKPLVVYLLQMRHSMLRGMAYAIAYSEPVKKHSTFNDTFAWVGQAFDYLSQMSSPTSTWTPQFNSLSEEQINQAALFLEEANETRSFLRSIGMTPVEQSAINQFFMHLSFSAFHLNDGSRRSKAILRFQSALKTYQ